MKEPTGMRIEVRGLRITYVSGFCLDIPGLEIRPGDRVALVGNNGAGKTTLIRALLGLTHVKRGAVQIDGTCVRRDRTWRARTGSFLGEPSLLSFLTPNEYWRFVGLAYGLSERHVQMRLKKLGGLVDTLLSSRTKLIREYSQGARSRIALAAALMTASGLLVLDEPFAHLDPRSQAQLEDLLRRRYRELRLTMLVSSHALPPLTTICSRVLVLHQGGIWTDEAVTPKSLEHVRGFLTSQ